MLAEPERHYKVVVNIEAQYSIWPDDREIPAGWVYSGVKGTQSECLAYIEAVWTDMRPLSVRMLLDEEEKEDGN